MCLVLIAKDVHPIYSLIILFNRDEFYARPTSPLAQWPHSTIYAGRDLLRQGTWLGINQGGHLGLLTNYHQVGELTDEQKSRGCIVKGFLETELDIIAYLQKIRLEHEHYNPFNFVAGNLKNLFYYSSAMDEYKPLISGVYGLSNAGLDTPWPKVERSKLLFKQLLAENAVTLENCLNLLADRTIPTSLPLPETGMDLELQHHQAAIFIAGRDHGTRSSSVIFIDRKGHVEFSEQTYGPDGRGELVTVDFS